jgi:peptide/nickel transport system substrate-binding protein
MARRQISIIDHNWEPVCQLCTELATFENGRAKVLLLKDQYGRDTGKKGVRTRFTLKDQLFWGDGMPVTTEDIFFTWQVGKHRETGVTNHQSFTDIIDIEVHDAKSFTIINKKLDYRYYALSGFNILPAHLERDAFKEPRDYRKKTLYQTNPTHPGLYNGPYRITKIVSGSYIVLEQNEYWKGKPPGFKQIQVKTIEKTSALEANLLSGAIDYIAGEAGLSLDQAVSFEKRHSEKYQVSYKPGLIYEHLDLMLDNPILSDLKVRKALIHSIDRTAISNRLFSSKQPVAHNKIHPLDWIHTNTVKKYSYDPQKARELLNDAGWNTIKAGIRYNSAGKKLQLELMSTAGNRSRELVEQVLQSYWKAVGIEIKIRNQPARVLFGETISKRKFTGLAMFAWLSAPESLPRTTLHSQSVPTKENNWSGQNYTGFKNQLMDQLIDSIEIELDKERRKKLWGKLQRLYAEQIPAIPLYFRANSFIVPKWLKGIRPTGHMFTSTNWVEDWHVIK